MPPAPEQTVALASLLHVGHLCTCSLDSRRLRTFAHAGEDISLTTVRCKVPMSVARFQSMSSLVTHTHTHTHTDRAKNACTATLRKGDVDGVVRETDGEPIYSLPDAEVESSGPERHNRFGKVPSSQAE